MSDYAYVIDPPKHTIEEQFKEELRLAHAICPDRIPEPNADGYRYMISDFVSDRSIFIIAVDRYLRAVTYYALTDEDESFLLRTLDYFILSKKEFSKKYNMTDAEKIMNVMANSKTNTDMELFRTYIRYYTNNYNISDDAINNAFWQLLHVDSKDDIESVLLNNFVIFQKIDPTLTANPIPPIVNTPPVIIPTPPQNTQKVTLLSSGFDYTALLSRYDIPSIDASIIKYYQAIQQLTDELMDKLDNCEQKMAPLIRDFNQISLRLSKKYEDNPHLTDEENALLSERQLYFQKKFSLGLSNAKSKILAVRKQADSLESRIDEIDNGDDSIHELALLEKEERASFSFVAENMAKIIKNALQKMDYFQNNRQFITNVIGLWETWSEDYRIFKTTYREDLKATCEEDGIEEDTWGKWYVDWQNIRFAIEQKLKPMIERGLKAPVPAVTETEVSIPEQSIRILNDYKHMVDTFFIEDRKGIYQKFAFQPGGEMQDKFETESELYKYTVSLQGALQEVIFNCENAEDRVFILTWANSLLDIQIDGILDFIADKDLKQLSETLLSEFAALKQKNYDTYLTDAQAYSKERSRREKEYNSLVFKMRKDLMKEWTKR